MIVINFFPGSLGFLVLKSIYGHWPQHFAYYPVTNTGTSNNHEITADLFLSNHSTVTQENRDKLLELSQRPSLVMTHDLQMIPESVLTSAKICNIICDKSAGATAVFMFWIKSGRFILDYVRNHNSDIDFYQAMLFQLHRFLQMPHPSPGAIDIDFWALDDYSSLAPLLDSVQQHYELPPRDDCKSWYQEQYSRSIQPLKLDIYQQFLSVYSRATHINYATDRDFRNFVDFIKHFHC